MSLSEIRQIFGRDGIRDLVPAYGKLGAITDDTQMSLFTAEALIRGYHRWAGRGIVDLTGVAHHAYLRWLHTQGERSRHHPFAKTGGPWPDGWLVSLPQLHARRAPGNTCLAALIGGERGSPDEPLNDSKGCGAVMRMAPVGLVPSLADAFETGSELGALTHGHPTGYLAAGALALIVARTREGTPIADAVADAVRRLERGRGGEETANALAGALVAAERGSPGAERLEGLGEGWVAEEALAIAVYCALAADSFEEAIVLAVSHGGDSDSTGAICGAILGTAHGPSVIPERWLEPIELLPEITRLADDLATIGDATGEPSDEGFARYPGW